MKAILPLLLVACSSPARPALRGTSTRAARGVTPRVEWRETYFATPGLPAIARDRSLLILPMSLAVRQLRIEVRDQSDRLVELRAVDPAHVGDTNAWLAELAERTDLVKLGGYFPNIGEAPGEGGNFDVDLGPLFVHFGNDAITIETADGSDPPIVTKLAPWFASIPAACADGAHLTGVDWSPDVEALVVELDFYERADCARIPTQKHLITW